MKLCKVNNSLISRYQRDSSARGDYDRLDLKEENFNWHTVTRNTHVYWFTKKSKHITWMVIEMI